MTDQVDPDISVHPYAKLFPRMGENDFEELKRDILIHGVRQPIVMYQHLILDGRHRFDACFQLGITCPQVEFDGDDEAALAFVLSTNLHRRHLNESQRATVAAKLATMQRGDNQHTSIEGTSQSQAAAMMSVGRASVERAKVVLRKGTPALIAAVEAGTVPVSSAAKLAAEPCGDQERVVAKVRAARPEKAKAIVASEIKKLQRARREAELADKSIKTTLSQERPAYNVILADPPWHLASWSENGMDRSAANHYPTMPTADIAALPIPAASDAVLFLWATVPMLPEALEVMRAWDFTYRSQIVWIKDRLGTGRWTRNKHELLLIGTRGDLPSPAMGTQSPSVIEAPVGRHSEKPAVFAELIEHYFPNMPKIELFSRSPRHGWAAHGNESGKAEPLATLTEVAA